MPVYHKLLKAIILTPLMGLVIHLDVTRQPRSLLPNAQAYFLRSIFNQEAEKRRRAEDLQLWYKSLYQAEFFYHTSQYESSLKVLNESLLIPQENDSSQMKIVTIAKIGIVYHEMGLYNQSIPYLRYALTQIIEQGPNVKIPILKRNNYCHYSGSNGTPNCYYSEYVANESWDYYKDWKALILLFLGKSYTQQGLYTQADEVLQESLAIAKDIRNKNHLAAIYESLGILHMEFGQLIQSEESYQIALTHAKEIENPRLEAAIYQGQGLLYSHLGQYDKVENLYQNALEIAKGTSTQHLEIDWYKQNVSLKKIDSGQTHLEQYQKSLEGNLHQNLGAFYTHLGRYGRALVSLQQSLNIYRAIRNPAAESTVLADLAIVHFNLNNESRSEEFYQEALEIAKKVKNRYLEETIYRKIGLMYYQSGNDSQAEKYLLLAIKAKENLSSNLGDFDKIEFFDNQYLSYQRLQEILIKQNKVEAALEISERGRARAFIELLAQRIIQVEQETLPNIEQFFNIDPEQFINVNIPTNSNINIEEIWAVASPPNVEKIREIAKNQNATIVQYSVIVDEVFIDDSKQVKESGIYIWVIKPTGEISFRRHNIKQSEEIFPQSLAEIIATARCFDNYVCKSNITVSRQSGDVPVVWQDSQSLFNWQAVSEQISSIPPHPHAELQVLHRLLIEPIADLLPSDPDERVIFVPHNSLFLVPFPALQDANGTYLIEKHTILTTPSIQVLDLTRQQKLNRLGNDGNLLIVGNPKMPSIGQPPQKLSSLLGAEKEAYNIARLLNATPLIGSQATKAAVVQQMLSSRIIHLATHGSFDPNRGIGSWLALTPTDSDDGFLTAEEIFELELNAELVVLSACDTGRGRITGDGVIGLSRSFISAGVPSVLVSLWKVDDAATAYLMREFYENWLDGSDKAQALRQAMLTTMQQYPHPENWAAFTLIGEAE